MNFTVEPLAGAHREAVVAILATLAPADPSCAAEAAGDLCERFLEAGYPAVAGKDETGKVVGAAFLSPFRRTLTLRKTALLTCAILPEHTRGGLGGFMLERLARGARALGIAYLVAAVRADNETGMAFHLSHQFRRCGRSGGGGRGRPEVIWLQRRI